MVIIMIAIYRFNITPIKLTVTIFTELHQKHFKFVWKHQRPQIAKAILRKKNGAGGIRLHDYTTKIYSSKQHGTGTKTEVWVNGTA